METPRFDTHFEETNGDKKKRRDFLKINSNRFRYDAVPNEPFELELPQSDNRQYKRNPESIFRVPGDMVGDAESGNKKQESVDDTFAKMIRDAGFDIGEVSKPAVTHKSSGMTANEVYRSVFSKSLPQVESSCSSTPEKNIPEVEDPLYPKLKRHIEQSAWHTIVEDEFNHEDLSARIRYGEEFERERREINSGQPRSTSYTSRYNARRNALLAFAAGLLIGNRYNRQRVNQELEETNAKLESMKQTIAAKYGQSAPNVVQGIPQTLSAEHQATIASQQLKPPETLLRGLQSVEHARSTNQLPVLPTAVAAPAKLPDGITQPEPPTGRPVSKDPQQHLLSAIGKRGSSVFLNPWLWLLAGLLLLIFFGASFLG